MEWQPIETAPMDTLVIVKSQGLVAPAISVNGARWYFWEGEVDLEDDRCVGDLNCWLDGFGPEEWMPLPEPSEQP